MEPLKKIDKPVTPVVKKAQRGHDDKLFAMAEKAIADCNAFLRSRGVQA
ncbi:hypothetical protein [Desulforegula conservatrix]|nr:hypothetical protein [Desulforegula conservatrix]